jgi:hypothetical protein
MRREQGNRTDTSRNAGAKSEYRQAIQEAGIPARTADRYQALAHVPEQQFEAALRDPAKPTPNELLRQRTARRKHILVRITGFGTDMSAHASTVVSMPAAGAVFRTISVRLTAQ